MYDLASFDARGAPTRLADGSLPSRPQQRKIANALVAAKRQVAKETARRQVAKETARRQTAAADRATAGGKNGDLPEG